MAGFGSGALHFSHFMVPRGIQGWEGTPAPARPPFLSSRGLLLCTFPEPAEKGKGKGKNVRVSPGGH